MIVEFYAVCGRRIVESEEMPWLPLHDEVGFTLMMPHKNALEACQYLTDLFDRLAKYGDDKYEFGVFPPGSFQH